MGWAGSMLEPVVTDAEIERRHLSEFVERTAGAPIDNLALAVRPFRGGLESVVKSVSASYQTSERRKSFRFVVKRLEGFAAREARTYEALQKNVGPSMLPRLLDVDRVSPDLSLLYLERINRVSAWPWRDTAMRRKVMTRLAELHQLRQSECSDGWDFESELAGSARSTLEFLQSLGPEPDMTRIRRGLPSLRRVVARLPAIRDELLGSSPLPATMIHGDAHPGNTIVRIRNSTHEPVFVDWARSRWGSPLEDVASWLQTLAHWEPAALREHDSMFGDYLQARGLPRRLGRNLRRSYWLAAASNVLGGALRYNVYIAVEAAPGSARRQSAIAQGEQAIRMIRRAELYSQPAG